MVVIFINQELFRHVIWSLYDAFYGLRPGTKEEIRILSVFIDNYMGLLAGFNKDMFNTIRTFMFEHQTLDDEAINFLWDTLTEADKNTALN